jgi:hypothetical protein
MRNVPIGILCAAIAAGCTTPSPAPNLAQDATRLPIMPYAEHEACIDAAPGDRVDYRWQASEPVGFAIRYREGGAMVAPIVRERSRGDSGILKVGLREHYCLHWQAGAAGALVDYRFVLRPPA